MMLPISIRKCGLTLLAGMFACGVASAAPEDKKIYQIRCAATGIVGGHHILWLRTGVGKKPVQVQLNTRVFSAPVKYKGVPVAQFFPTKAAAMAEKPPKPIAEVKLTGRSVMIVFQPRKDASGYEVSTTAEKNFPFGSFRVVNFSKDKVRMDMGDKKRVIPPAKSITYRFLKGNKALPVSIIVRSAKTGKPRYVRRSNWSIAPTQRELVLLLPNPENGLVRAKHFVDSKIERE
ncbi:MAG TPA: hypothetical protein DCG06_11355 [Deltaproteobacteria bacterium]|nr:hypothetical protein [Deltaproteobacteria bacterium]